MKGEPARLKKNNLPPLEAIRLIPRYQERVWGGHSLRPDAPPDSKPVGEAWLVYEGNEIDNRQLDARTLGELAEEYGVDLLGKRAFDKTGTRFPLLIKLLDCQDWLSLQVHPDDTKAEELEGPGQFGKTEAWYFIKAEPGARVIAGIEDSPSREEVAQAIRDGSIINMAHYQGVGTGDAILMPAGTIHALGPGVLVYEVQQTSDITYRIFDWNRPQQEGRALHIEQSVAVSQPGARGEYIPAGEPGAGSRRLLSCDYFSLDLVSSQWEPLDMDTAGDTFHALTTLEGELEVEGSGWGQIVKQYETVLVPAACRGYRIYPRGAFRALIASVG
jgi:mannose-6-phosphate isomerase